VSKSSDPKGATGVAGADPSFTPAYSNYVLGVLFVVYVFNFIDRQILSILLDPIKAELGATDTQMGFLTGFAFAVFYTVAGIPIARIADKGPRRTLIAVGLTVWSGMTAVCGLVTSFAQLAAARIGVGVGEAAGSPPAHSLISDYFPPERRATAIAIYSSGINVGVMLGYLLGGWINEFFNWRTAFFVVGIPGVIFAFVVRFTIREPPRGHSETTPADDSTNTLGEVFRFMFSLRSFRYLSVATGLSAFSAYGFGAWVPAYLGRVHGMGTGEMGTWLGIENGVAGVLGTVLGGRLADRYGAKDVRWYMWVSVVSLLFYAPFVYGFLLMDNPRIGLVLYFPAIFFASMYLGPSIAITHSLVKLRMRALASAILFFMLNMIGMGLGPQIVGILNDWLEPQFGIEAVRYSLAISATSKFLAIALFLMAARSLKEDLKAKDRL
jgi:MFS family permease